MNTRYICTLPLPDRFLIYKSVKRYLLLMGVYSYTDMLLALSGKLSDIDYILKKGDEK